MRMRRSNSITGQMMEEAMSKAMFSETSQSETVKALEDRREDHLTSSFKAHGSFKSKSRSPVRPTKSMMQVLETRAKEDAIILSHATAAKAVSLQSPASSRKKGKGDDPNRALGLNAGLAFESLSEVFKEHGSLDDLYRPENNATGHVAPRDCDVVQDVMCRHEKKRVEDLLRLHGAWERPDPTVPRSPRLGSPNTSPTRSKIRLPRTGSPARAETSPSARSLDYGVGGFDADQLTVRSAPTARSPSSPAARGSSPKKRRGRSKTRKGKMGSKAKERPIPVS